MSSRSALVWPALVLPLLVFAWVGVSQVVSHVPLYDDAYNATVAKNLAAGFGYVSSFDSLIPFNPEVTTGPTLILPAALLVRVFGPAYWVPALTTLLVCVLLFVVIGGVWVKQLDRHALLDGSGGRAALDVALTLLLLCLMWVSEVRKIELLGEFPAALFVCAGAAALFLPRSSGATLGVGGVLLGLAIVTKTVALILVAPIFVVWMAFFLFGGESAITLRKKAAGVLFVAGAIAVPTVLFELYKLLHLGFLEFRHLKVREASFFRRSGSGVSELRSSAGVFEFIAPNFRKNLHTLQEELGGAQRLWLYLAAFASVALSYAWKLAKRKRFTGLDQLALALLLAVAACFSWWLGFGAHGYYRHVSPAAVVGSFAIVVSALALLRHRALRWAGVAVLAWILISPFRWHTLLEVPRVPRAEVDALRAASAYLVQLRAEGKTLLGCGWWANRRLEYVMPDPLNFRQCHTGPFENAALVIDRQFWDWEKSEETRRFESGCSRMLFDRQPYQVLDCAPR